MFLKLFATVLCLWKAVAFEAGVSESRGAAGSPEESHFIQGFPAPEQAALESPTIQIAEWLQPTKQKTHTFSGICRVTASMPAYPGLRKGWQSRAAVEVFGSRTQQLLFPFHAFL